MLAASPKPFALEVKRGAFGGELKMSGDSNCDVIASLTTLARLACTGCEASAVALLASDLVRRARAKRDTQKEGIHSHPSS